MNTPSPSALPLLCCGPTPAVQRALTFSDWNADSDVARASRVHLSVGGKATNAARAITHAGGQATVLGFAGGDNGERMRRLLHEEGLDGVWVDTDTETRVCQTLLDSEGRRIRELVENARPVTLREWTEFFAKVEQALPFHGGLLLCGSLPDESPPDVYATLIRLAHDAGRPVAIDAKGPELLAALGEEPELVKINLRELRGATREDDPATGVDRLAGLGVGHILITDGPRPARARQGRKSFTFELPEIRPVNPIGGGDTVTGVTFLHIVNRESLRDAARAGLGAGMAQTLTTRPAVYETSEADRLARAITVRKA